MRLNYRLEKQLGASSHVGCISSLGRREQQEWVSEMTTSRSNAPQLAAALWRIAPRPLQLASPQPASLEKWNQSRHKAERLTLKNWPTHGVSVLRSCVYVRLVQKAALVGNRVRVNQSFFLGKGEANNQIKAAAICREQTILSRSLATILHSWGNYDQAASPVTRRSSTKSNLLMLLPPPRFSARRHFEKNTLDKWQHERVHSFHWPNEKVKTNTPGL